MKVIFFETTNASPHLETSLELARRHLVKGDQVAYHFIGHAVDYSEFVVSLNRLIPTACFPEIKGAQLLEHPRFEFTWPKKGSLQLQLDLPIFSDVDDLLRFRHKSYNAGISTASSLISLTKKSRPNLLQNQKLVKSIMGSGISVYEYCCNILAAQSFDRVYLFNGRFANGRAILDAAIETRTPYLVHERGADKSRFFLRSYMPHDFDSTTVEIERAWQDRSDVGERLAVAWFESMRSGADVGWSSFTSHQKKNFININQASVRRLICYFSSSDDEFAAVGDLVKWDRWPNQLSAVDSLLRIVRAHPELELVIRIHPHLAEKGSSELDEWLDLDLPPNATLLPPNDPTDSYALVNCADVVVTAGSTVGIESVFWGTPSICLGPSLYSYSNAVHLPMNDVELEEKLLDQSLTVRPEEALPYGHYMATFGELYSYYKPETLFRGRFMGVDLQPSGLCRFLRRSFSLTNRLMLEGRKGIKRFIGALT